METIMNDELSENEDAEWYSAMGKRRKERPGL